LSSAKTRSVALSDLSSGAQSAWASLVADQEAGIALQLFKTDANTTSTQDHAFVASNGDIFVVQAESAYHEQAYGFGKKLNATAYWKVTPTWDGQYMQIEGVGLSGKSYAHNLGLNGSSANWVKGQVYAAHDGDSVNVAWKAANGKWYGAVVSDSTGAMVQSPTVIDGSRFESTKNVTDLLGQLSGEDGFTGFTGFTAAVMNFESGLNPAKLQLYKDKYTDSTAVTYWETEVVNGIRYPKTDALGNLVSKRMSYQEYFDVLGVGALFNKDTATEATVKQMQYGSTNMLNFVGYQVGEAALMEAGYYTPPIDPVSNLPKYYIWTTEKFTQGVYEKQVTLEWGTKIVLTKTNTWSGTFTGKNGINSLADLKDPTKHELMIQDVWTSNYNYIEKQLKAVNKTWSDVLNQSWADNWTDSNGQAVSGTVSASMSGVLAAAHLVGAQGVTDLLLTGARTSDETNTGVLDYMRMFGGYKTPWGTDGSDSLQGSDYANKFYTKGGNDTVTTGAGADTVVISKSAGSTTTLTDYDLSNDQVVLKGFANKDAGTLSAVADGVELTLADAQKVLFKGANLNALQAVLSQEVHYSSEYAMSWNGATEHNQVLSGFDLDYDKLVAPSGAAFGNLSVTAVGTGQVKLSFVKNQDGTTGSGYILNIAKADITADLLSKIFVGISGAPTDASGLPGTNSPTTQQPLGEFTGFTAAVMNFESGLNPAKLQLYKDKYTDSTAVTYWETEVVNGIRYPKTDALGNLVSKRMSYQEYFDVLGVGALFNKDTATEATVKQMQYGSTNMLNFVGYQVGEAALMEAGYYTPPIDPVSNLPKYYIWTTEKFTQGVYEKQVTLEWGTKIVLTKTNTWSGTFTGKNGINSLADLKDPTKHELMIQDVWTSNYNYIEKQLKAVNKTWSDVLNQSWADNWTDSNGQAVSGTVSASMSGVLAAAHLVGAQGVTDLLLTGARTSDETNTGVLDYMRMFGGYKTPWGTDGSDSLQGSDYANKFYTKGGNDTVTTGAGADTVVISKSAGSTTTLTDYDLSNDQVVLKGFANKDAGTLSAVADGVELTLADAQKVLFKGANLNALQAALSQEVHYSSEYAMSWDGAVEGNRVLAGFDVHHDKLVAPTGAAFKDLYIAPQVSDWHWLLTGTGQPNDALGIKVTFAADNAGWVGDGYLVKGASYDNFVANLGNIFVGVSGGPGDVTKGGSSMAIDMANAVGARFTGSSGNEVFQNLGNQGVTAGAGGATVVGGGGRDTFKIGANQLSWYGTKELTIADFKLGDLLADANADVLDLSALVASNVDVTFSRNAAVSTTTDVTLTRVSEPSAQTVLHLQNVDLALFEAARISSGQVIQA
jgi:Ca2+-binding RTX toxin-like protein